MKKKKSKQNKETSTSKGEGPKQVIFNHYIKEMEEKTQEFKEKNKIEQNIKFYLLQSINNKDKVRDMIFNLVYFYDNNFVGNKNFMHIPNISNVLDNVLKYPIMISTKTDDKGNEEIIGTSTIKFERNQRINQNPYFPTKNEDVLSVTGILTKLNNVEEPEMKVKGIGKELFKSAIKSAYQINKKKNLRFIAEIDCRNNNSLKSICKAVKELQEENINVNLIISGYYEIKNEFQELTEAPTFVLEVEFDKKLKSNKVYTEFNYSNCDNINLFSELNNVIQSNTKESKQYINKVKNNTVIYHNIKPINALNVKLDIGDTADGNNRTPVLNLQLEPANNVVQ